jgi:GDP-L-fucose synthase
MRNPLEFGLKNLEIATSVVNACYVHEVEKLVSTLSTCIYPDNCTNITGDSLHDGPPHESNFAYAHAKRELEVLSRALNMSYNSQGTGKPSTRAITVVPTNVYGPYDNFMNETSHVIPSLVRKFVTASDLINKVVNVKGTGRALRQFIYSKDLGRCIWKALDEYNSQTPLICSPGKTSEVSIKDVCDILSRLTNVSYEFEGNSNNDGQLKKTVESPEFFSNVNYTTLEEGLQETITWQYLCTR